MYITPVILKDVSSLIGLNINTLDVVIDRENSAKKVELVIHSSDFSHTEIIHNRQIHSGVVDNHKLYKSLDYYDEYVLLYLAFTCATLDVSPLFCIKYIREEIENQFKPGGHFDIHSAANILRINRLSCNASQVKYFYNRRLNKISLQLDKTIDIFQLPAEAAYYHYNILRGN